MNSLEKEIVAIAEEIEDHKQRFLDVKISPVEHSRLREKAVCKGIMLIASICGAKLEQINYIDAAGELPIRVLPNRQNSIPGEVGHYGEAFAKWLSTIPRRTGVVPTHTPAEPTNGWCSINHFHAESLINAFAKDVQERHFTEG